MKFIPTLTRPRLATLLDCCECQRLSRELHRAWHEITRAIEAGPGPELVDHALREFEKALDCHHQATRARIEHERLTGHIVNDPSPLPADPGF